ncbi:MAG: hypothetical protein HS113_15020 [Verrucomicrobiales bacterium]|nr:hypothetical protein [Verrucomicrobiales bacterium]
MAVKNRTALNVVAVATLLVAWTAFYRIHHPRPPRIDRRPHEALGEVLAEETTRHLRPGARLIVIARDAAAFQVPAAEAQVEAFLRAIRKAGRRVDELRSIRLDPLRLTAVPPGDFFDLLRLGRADDVIVSFLGPPVLEPAQQTALPPKRPQVLAVCSLSAPAQVNLRELFERGLLRAVVLSRPDAPAHAAPGSGQSTFAQRFQLVTAANLHDLPEPVGHRLR